MSSDPYYDRFECSNSDLSDLNKLLNPQIFDFDFEEVLRFGTLFDCLVTELHKVNVYNRTVEGVEGAYSIADIELAKDMKRAFYRDKTCEAFMKLAECQKISIGHVEYEWNNFKFMLQMRAKWDLWIAALKQGADIKTTTATTLKQFTEACHHFKYFRSRAVYMNLEGSNADMLIGVSKVNLQVFKIPIMRGDINFNKGQQEAAELGFSYWQLFDGFLTNNLTIT